MMMRFIEVAGLAMGLATMLVGERAQAQLAPLKQAAPPSAGDQLASQSARAELTGDHAKALQLADDAIKTDPKDPWGYYDRGDALGAVHKIDEAVAVFQEAERRFSEGDVWGKSAAIWGRANVFSQAGRCQDAAPLFERYASFVEKVDEEAAALAQQYAKHCTARRGPPRTDPRASASRWQHA